MTKLKNILKISNKTSGKIIRKKKERNSEFDFCAFVIESNFFSF